MRTKPFSCIENIVALFMLRDDIFFQKPFSLQKEGVKTSVVGQILGVSLPESYAMRPYLWA